MGGASKKARWESGGNWASSSATGSISAWSVSKTYTASTGILSISPTSICLSQPTGYWVESNSCGSISYHAYLVF